MKSNQYIFIMKTGKIVMGLSAAIAIGVSGVYLNDDQELDSIREVAEISTNDMNVNQNIESSFSFNANENIQLNTKDGSIIYIDANSFEFSNGEAVKEIVDVRFKEYHNVIDVIKSRIEMQYDSAGTKYHLQSAGMFEITGTSQGKPIQFKKGKTASVELVTNTEGGKFNFYKFEKEGWKFLYKDNNFTKNLKPKLKKLEDKISALENEVEVIEEEMPFSPGKADPNKLNVKVEFSKKEFPELSGFQDLLFEFINDSIVKDDFEQYDWDYVEIEKGNSGTYQLLFFHEGDKYAFNAKPVLESGQENGAFATLFNGYTEELKHKKELKKDLQLKRVKLYKKDEKKRDSSLLAYKVMMAQQEATNDTGAKLRRAFQIASFGLFNCDCPANLPEGALFVADFSAEDSDSLNHHQAYLVEKNTKRLFTYYESAYSKFQCNPASENMIVVLTDSNQIYTCDNSEFKGVRNGKQHEFSLELKEVNTKSELTIKAGLNF